MEEYKRLTEECWRNLDPWEKCGQDNFCKRDMSAQGGCINGCIVPKIYNRLSELEDAIESGELQFVQNQPLTLEQLKALPKGEWIWYVDYERPTFAGYCTIISVNVTHIYLQQHGNLHGRMLEPYGLYGKDWVAYKNKEQAEAKPKGSNDV